GPVYGIFHAAGETSNEIIRTSFQELTENNSRYQLSPKVYGTLALYEALSDHFPDFVLLTSSLATVLGGLGLTSYVAANGFIDAFAAFANQRDPRTRWISVNTAEW